jgi:aspartyl-tRNA(Asn)/glutamyl-tRNA(Gln) amidotransferase subunit C
MAFSENDVAKVARLARIRVKPEERAPLAKEMTSILGWIEQLQSVDTSGIAPLASVSNQTLPWRKDVVTDGNIQKEVLSNAPVSMYGCFAVPKVIE